ncbi:CNH domain-containing protein [Russula ochroleuca]|uniref:CNH domain-containing protein n=1 Tax=Russula ochroleuca TaxID=152965 RepID=A0A9P5MT41_9AGAM|nr:CNH domain-containing protein [Russula ochroleuca]
MSHANTTNEPSTSEVFQVVTLSSDTFIIQSTPAQQSRGGESTSSGKVNCSLSFASTDGHACLAIGCEEGLWIGYRDDSQSLRHASHLNLKMVTQCAMLERFGVFLVLVDQSLFAYDIESLVPSSLESANTSHTPEKLNDTRGVQFFSVGILAERTLVLYMIKDGSDSVFHALDIIVGNDNDGGPLTAQLDLPEYRSRWFRVYRLLDRTLCSVVGSGKG